MPGVDQKWAEKVAEAQAPPPAPAPKPKKKPVAKKKD